MAQDRWGTGVRAYDPRNLEIKPKIKNKKGWGWGSVVKGPWVQSPLPKPKGNPRSGAVIKGRDH